MITDKTSETLVTDHVATTPNTAAGADMIVSVLLNVDDDALRQVTVVLKAMTPRLHLIHIIASQNVAVVFVKMIDDGVSVKASV